ncbi:MAG TPA: IS110 family transposase [Chloroflexota bacterium]|nr:IS110 family transposase [Chloroflexota bacterium]
MVPLIVGVDIAKLTFSAARWQGERGEVLGTFANTAAGFAALEQALGAPASTEPAPVHLILEPTGGYEQPLAHWAHARGWRVSLPNPRQVRDWGQGLGRRAKTDRQDALLLAHYGARCQPPAWQPLAAEVSELDSLLRRKTDLEQLLRQERNRQQALAARPGIAAAVPASVARVIGLLEEELRTLEEAIAALQRQHAALAEAAEQLQTVPGIGPRTVLPLLVLLARWDRLTAGAGTPKALVAYVGLDPQPFASGTSVQRRATISRQGERNLRRRLFAAALGGTRGANPLRACYDRLVGRGKPKKLALVAAARKLLLWAWAVFRHHTTFDAARFAAAT